MRSKWSPKPNFGDKIQLKIQDAFSIQKTADVYLKVDLLDLKNH